MTQRFYLTNSTTPYTPATKRGGWEQAGATLIRLLGSRPGGTAATAAVATGSTGAANDVLWGRWVSAGAVAAGTLSGTAQAIVGAVESNAATNAFLYLHIYVTTGDSDTPRGTVLSNFAGATEFTTTANGRDSGAQTLSSLAVSAGDRLVVELGYRSVSADTTARTATMNYGNTGTTDLAAASTSVTTQPGWIDFSGADGIWSTPVSSLSEDFSGGSLPATFTDLVPGGVSVSGGELLLDAGYAPGGQFSGVTTAAQYQLRNSSITWQLPTAQTGSGSYGGAEVDTAGGSGSYAGIYVNISGSSTISFELMPSDPSPTSIAFNPATSPTWLKLEHTGSALNWYTSPDNSTYTLQRTTSTIPQWANWSDLHFSIAAGSSGSSPDNLHADNINPPATTTVTSQIDLRWAVSSAVAKQLDLRWAVSTIVTDQIDLRWAVLSTVTDQLDLRWAVSSTITDQLDLRWAISTIVTDQLDLSWAVSATVTDQLDLRWAVLSTVTDQLDLRWAVLAAVTDQLDLRWAISSTVTDQLDLRWAVLSTVTDQLDLRWVVNSGTLTTVTTQLDLQWAVSSTITNQLDLRWAVLSSVTSEIELLWAVRSIVAKQLDLRWAVLTGSTTVPVTSRLELLWLVLAGPSTGGFDVVTGSDWLAYINEARALHERAEDRRNNPLECPEHRWPLEQTDGVYHCKFGGHVVTTPTRDK